jgi:predicted glycosyltransferase/glycosyltransferase involved in cell wall biosynthesis
MVVFHLLSGYIDHLKGGLEQSINRVAGHLAKMKNSEVILYSRHDLSQSFQGESNLKHVFLRNISDKVREPLGIENNLANDRYRVDILLFKQKIIECQKIYTDSRHVIISFYISSSGFVAQHVASQLNLPHIASIRGSDFHQDLFNPSRFSLVEFVIKKATWIITTNIEQENSIKKDFDRNGRIFTIYNSIPSIPLKTWEPKDAAFFHIVADCGYSYKKGTHLLIEVIAQLKADGHPVVLSIVGNTDKEQAQYWQKVREDYSKTYPLAFNFKNYIPISAIPEFLLSGDLYCSFSLSEGCSNSSLMALSLGIPIVATKTGALPDIGKNCENILLSESTDMEQFKSNIIKIMEQTKTGNITVNYESIKEIRKLVSPMRELTQWEDILSDVLPKKETIVKKKQKRILFFLHDGSGLGHLQRISRIAKALQGDCACLIVSGHRSASWIVPEECEYIHLPSLDSLLPKKSGYWGREPFLKVDKSEAIKFRKEILKSVIKSFNPDAVVVDFLPLGKFEELEDIIYQHSSLKYFIMRGVLDRSDNIALGVFRTHGEHVLEEKYDRIIVTGDRRVIDVVEEYGLSKKIENKISYVGYVSDPITPELRSNTRGERGIPNRKKWIVCSAGGGVYGEKFIEECSRISRKLLKYYFDIVTGPRTALKWQTTNGLNGRVRFIKEANNLGLMHGSADLVICHGGYNSLVETLEGSAQIICHPIQVDVCDEQYIHPMKLNKYVPITVNTNLNNLEDTLVETIKMKKHEFAAGRKLLDFNGIETIRNIIFKDLGLNKNTVGEL